MTIGLSNSSTRAASYGSTAHMNSGGGPKKCGFPYIIGRTSSISLVFRENTMLSLKFMRKLPRGFPANGIVNMNIPMNMDHRIGMR